MFGRGEHILLASPIVKERNVLNKHLLFISLKFKATCDQYIKFKSNLINFFK